MHQRRRAFVGISVVLALSVVAAACSAGDDGSTSTTAESSPATTGSAARSGQIVLGAEQWPECLNPVTQCANATWMHWAVDAHVLPRLMELDAGGTFVPSPVLAGAPELSGSGTDTGAGPFTVTYRIRPEAVWDDGSPITSEDVAFTWEAHMQTTGTISTTGWEQVQSVDTTDPKVAVVRFAQPYANWQDLWGGTSTYLLKKAAFEATDVADMMIDDLPFSGGPWRLRSFSTTEAVLVPNDAYWDPERAPLVERVTIVPLSDSETQINALLAGEVDAIYPSPTPGIVEQLDAPDIDFRFGAGVNFEGLWFNQGSLKDPTTPLRDRAVREALMFAVDRAAVLAEVITPSFPDTSVLNCGGWVPTVGLWCDQSDYADVAYDPARVAALLEPAGWARGADGIYAKEGRRLSLSWQTVAQNKRREDIQALVIPQARAAGIELVPDNSDANTLFQSRVPQMDTEVGLYAQKTSPNPSVSAVFACENIPSPANDFSGQNVVGWCDPVATELMQRADATPDPADRLALVHQIGDSVRAQAVWLPFFQLPLVTAWNTEKLAGPVGAFASSTYSGLNNVYDWSVSN